MSGNITRNLDLFVSLLLKICANSPSKRTAQLPADVLYTQAPAIRPAD